MKTRVTLSTADLKNINIALHDLLEIHMERVMEETDNHKEKMFRHSDPDDDYVYQEIYRTQNLLSCIDEQNTVDKLDDLQRRISRAQTRTERQMK
jgi:hypothetical protein